MVLSEFMESLAYPHHDVPRRRTLEQERALKRAMLAVMLVVQLLGYKILTEARYEGQGLATIYFRLSTMSDLLSIAFTMAVVLLIIAAIVHPERIGLGR